MGGSDIGQIMFVVIAGSLLAVPATFGLLWLFKRSVIRGMNRPGGGATGAAVPAPPDDADRHRPSADKSHYRETRASLFATLGVYVLAASAYALVFTVATFLSDGVMPNLVSFAYVASTYTPPLVFAAFSLLPAGGWRRASVGVYAGAVVLLLAVTIIRNPGIASGILSVWFTSAAVSVLLVAFTLRRLRAAGPLVLAIAVTAMAGANLLQNLIDRSSALVQFIDTVGLAARIPAYGLLVMSAFGLVGAALALVVGWPLLKLVGYRYRRKRLSDQSLFVDTVFIGFAIIHALPLVFSGPEWLLTGLVAFLAYKLVAVAGLRLARFVAPEGRIDLLLLRPFSLGRRSERLFDNIAKVWLRAGPIHMIAGPDLVMATVAPPEFLAFLGGRLARRFVHNEAELAQHVAELDTARDPDGRYRVNQLFCRDDVWQAAMRALAARSDIILMDLRGLTAANRGCLYELAVLIGGVSLRRVYFAVDGTTDRAFLEWAVASLWEQLPPDSPNRAYDGITSRLLWVDDSPKSRAHLLEALMQPLAQVT